MRYFRLVHPSRPQRVKVQEGALATKGATMALLQARGVVQARGREREEKAKVQAQEEVA